MFSAPASIGAAPSFASCEAVGRRGRSADWSALADEWRREGYIRGIARIRAGETPYVSSDVLFRRKLDELLPKYGISGLDEAEVDDLAHAWRRLDPWPDTVAGLQRLKTRFIISPLSNGSFATLTAMAKRAGMPWDCIISTELRQTFKPEREAYLLAATLLDLRARADHAGRRARQRPERRAGGRPAHRAGAATAGVGARRAAAARADPSFDYVATRSLATWPRVCLT